ncbi:hypothetical protein GQ53DRAFT_54265 [Thozetella sp. PMI_491]|nr:hypothetical protein GQ53DRAFT_54265 [Thozetella sp. PMI_491]
MWGYETPTVSSDNRTCDPATQASNWLTSASAPTTTTPSLTATPTPNKIDTRGNYEICFGMIPISLPSIASVQGDGSPALTNVELSGNSLRFTLVNSGIYLGALESSILVQLVHEIAITLEAIATIPEIPKGGKAALIKDIPVEIVVYGMRKDKKIAGDLLAEADLALQHPREFDTTVEYDNPHYLVRPGSRIPKTGATHLEATSRNKNNVLEESEKARLLQVFDSASGQGIICHAVQSPRLKTELKGHQLQALAFMLEKERGSVRDPVYPSLWEPVLNEDGSKRYRHIITNMQSALLPLPLKGGILADDMGLGKTITTLALIASCLDSLGISDGEVREKATLIVAPKSVIPEWERQIKSHAASNQLTYHFYQNSPRSFNSVEFRSSNIILVTYDTLRSG